MDGKSIPTSPSREERHMRLYHATNGIDELLNRIKTLKYRISGPEPEEAQKLGNTEHCPVLAEVLEVTSDRIRDYVNQGITLIDEIDSSLF